MKQSILKNKSIGFAKRMVKMVKYIQESQKEYILTKQILRSGTGIGASIHEAFYAQSIPDFINKPSISLKEAAETDYWLILLKEGQYITINEYESMTHDNSELIKLLTASINTSKKRLNLTKAMAFKEPEIEYNTAVNDFNPEKELNREIDVE